MMGGRHETLELTTPEAALLAGKSYAAFLRWARARGVLHRRTDGLGAPLLWNRDSLKAALASEPEEPSPLELLAGRLAEIVERIEHELAHGTFAPADRAAVLKKNEESLERVRAVLARMSQEEREASAPVSATITETLEKIRTAAWRGAKQ